MSKGEKALRVAFWRLSLRGKLLVACVWWYLTPHGVLQDEVIPPGTVEHTKSFEEKAKAALANVKKMALHGVSVDIHDIVETDDLVAAIHKDAEVFPEKAEQVFAYLQVCVCACVRACVCVVLLFSDAHSTFKARGTARASLSIHRSTGALPVLTRAPPTHTGVLRHLRDPCPRRR
jgi:hypothetical protein